MVPLPESTGLIIITDQAVSGIYTFSIRAMNQVGTTTQSYTFSLQKEFSIANRTYPPGDLIMAPGESLSPSTSDSLLCTFDYQNIQTGKPIEGVLLDSLSGIFMCEPAAKYGIYTISISFNNKYVWFDANSFPFSITMSSAVVKTLGIR